MKSFNFPGGARLLAVLSAAAIATLGSVLAASPAHAADTAQHCMMYLPTGEILRCFDTFDEAKQFADDAGMFDPPKDGTAVSGAGSAVAARSVSPATGGLKVIGIEYDYPLWDPAGGTFWELGPTRCTNTTSDVDYSKPDYSVYGWNQRISSFQVFSNCWAKHYDLVNFGGLAVGYQGSQAIINSALNNDTSSERWS